MNKSIFGCLGIGVIVLVAVVIFALVGGVHTYNSLVGQSQNVDAKWAEVETQYQARADKIKNLVPTVEGAANFEKSTLVEITKARASVGQLNVSPSQAPATPEQMQQFEAAQGQLGNALSRLLVVSERYPDLKANENFRDLQTQIEGIENRIATARYDFNSAAQTYNVSVQQFPTVVFARLLGFSIKPYFKAAAGSENAPDVKFDFNSPATNTNK